MVARHSRLTGGMRVFCVRTAGAYGCPGGAPVTVAGESFGGPVALKLAAMYPDAVQVLVVINSGSALRRHPLLFYGSYLIPVSVKYTPYDSFLTPNFAGRRKRLWDSWGELLRIEKAAEKCGVRNFGVAGGARAPLRRLRLLHHAVPVRPAPPGAREPGSHDATYERKNRAQGVCACGLFRPLLLAFGVGFGLLKRRRGVSISAPTSVEGAEVEAHVHARLRLPRLRKLNRQSH